MKMLKNQSKKEKKKKDPSAPKRPRSAYILFCTDIREKIKEENPEVHNNELMKYMAAKWSNISDKKKAKYTKKALKDKNTFSKRI